MSVRAHLRTAFRSLLAAVALVCLSLPALASESGWSLWRLAPENIGTYGKDVDDLYVVILWLVVATFIITEGILLLFLIRYRAKPGGRAVYTSGNHRLEVIWTIIPGAILFWLALYQIGTWKDIKVEKRPLKDGLVVQVMAKQFAWYFRYAGPDGIFGTSDDVTSQVLHVPVNTRVTIQLRSLDVLHSFFLPNLRLKQDTVPGLTVTQWFQATKTSETARRELLERLESERAQLGPRVERDLEEAVRSRLKAEKRPVSDLPAEMEKELSERPLDARITDWIASKGKSFSFEIACAELCGLGHTDMRGFLVVHSDDPGAPDGFFPWIDKAYVDEVREYGVDSKSPLVKFWPRTDAKGEPLKVEDTWLRDNWPAELKAKWPRVEGDGK